MEQALLAASIRSREDYELIHSYIDMRKGNYDKLFKIVMTKIGEYYARDREARLVIPSVLLAQINETIRNDKHVTLMQELIAESMESGSSDTNVRAIVLLAKQQETADKLTQAFVNGGDNVDELIEELKELRAMTSLDELSDVGMETFHDIDLGLLIAQEFDPSSLIEVYPASLNRRLDGGAKRGHHIVVYGRPESMKSGTCINANCGFARQGRRSLYLINEDRPQDIIIRHVSNLSGMTKYQIQADPIGAQRLAEENGFGNIIVVSASPGTPEQIEDYIERYEPDCVVIDQLRNLHVKADSRVNQLEYAATAARKIAKRTDTLVLSVTQAGDSAEGKAVLDMGDVDFSNTGIPAQADVMIGVGVDPTLEAEGRRMFSLPKNKISGNHEHFPVNVVPQLSRVTSV